MADNVAVLYMQTRGPNWMIREPAWWWQVLSGIITIANNIRLRGRDIRHGCGCREGAWKSTSGMVNHKDWETTQWKTESCDLKTEI